MGTLTRSKSGTSRSQILQFRLGRHWPSSHISCEHLVCTTQKADELYVAIFSQRNNDVIMFYEHGGVDIGDARSVKIEVSLDDNEMMPTEAQLSQLIGNLDDKTSARLKQLNFLCSDKWKTRSGSNVEFPAPFGRDLTKEEQYIADLDAKTGASLKLTILNRKGRIWTMVAGGGASVVFTDTVCDLGGASELANYGEYSGDPSETQTFEYAKTLLSVMTEGPPHPKGKGIVRAFEVFVERIREHKVTIFVRRGGPNYQEGLRRIKDAAQKLELPVHVFGPETHMTAIVGAALGIRDLPEVPHVPQTTGQFLLSPERNTAGGVRATSRHPSNDLNSDPAAGDSTSTAVMSNSNENHQLYESLFENNSKAIIWGQQQKAIQGMLDFDYVCRRLEPSVVASTYPFTGDNKQKYYFGHREILIPAYKSMAKAFATHPDATILSTKLSHKIRVIAIIAEGVPENQTRKLIKMASEKGVTLIGPATVGGIKPGCFKIGNTGGMMDNILASRLYRPGSVAYVSRSGGMSNELNNIIGANTDGVFEGIAIGGDRYPGSTYTDHIMRYQNDDRVKMMVLLGEVQFGHAGASANALGETAAAKNAALKEAGARVPHSFDDLGKLVKETFNELVDKGIVVLRPEVPPPAVPMDYAWARELGLIRKPASFMTSICDERGEELNYAGVPITKVLEQDIGVGGVLGLNDYLPMRTSLLKSALMLTADHGPAVSGAHNTIVCARAGKDLISSLVSGLLTIGDRFGGALDGAARQFSEAVDKGWSPMQFVNEMRKQGKHIMGIGHRVKSINNPDKRVEILKNFALDRHQFKQETPLLEYALEVEKITTAKKPNLILNVDGAIGVIFVDILRQSGMFTPAEAQETIEIGALNGLFVLGRSLGFIGHYLDQRRLKQGLYRHPWDDISYIMPERDLVG
ncbi:CoA binding domain protein [Cooperia oncophora]